MGILDRAVSVKNCSGHTDLLKIFLAGFSGTGKSTICGTAPGEKLYLFTELQGAQAFRRMAGDHADILRVENVGDLGTVLNELRAMKPMKYDTVILDSLTEMQLMIVDHVGRKKGGSRDEPIKLSIPDYGYIHDKTKGLVRSFRDLPCNVVITCLADMVLVGEGDTAERVIKFSLVGQKLPGQICQFFNLVGFTYRSTSKKGNSAYRVVFDGRPDLVTKGLPGLRYREKPNISYWYDRIFRGAEPADPDAQMIEDPRFCREETD